MTPFLKEIAIYLVKRFPDNLEQLNIVFPNKRAGLFFRQYLSELTDKPIWSPNILDIDSFVKQQSDWQVPDKFSLLFDLYEVFKDVYQSEAGNEVESFDSFYPWGTMLLRDFNEIDKHLVDAKDLFRIASELKTLDSHFDYLTDEQVEIIASFWKNIDISKTSKHKDSFIKLWEVLYMIYSSFRKKLEGNKLGYEGMLYRKLAENLQSTSLKNSFKFIVFAGFNILNKSEYKIFDYFKKEKNALFFWDFDRVFLDKKNFDTAELIKKNIKKFPPPSDFKLESFSSEIGSKKIEFIGVPLEVGQAKLVGDRLNKLPSSQDKEQPFKDSKKIDKTAIVLPAEHLLFPVINSLPGDNKDVNITMGYPLNNTQLSSLFELIIDLWQNTRSTKNKTEFYYKDVIAILKHPYILFLNPKEINQCIEEIKKFNWIFISNERLIHLFNFASKLFDGNNNSSYFECFLDILYEIYQSQKEDRDSFDTEYIYRFYIEINRLKEVVSEKEILLSDKVFYKLLKEIIRSIKIPFTGEPLSGIQIMGVLETRCLDFENLFILSMNEGKYPSVNYDGSFIPYNLRKAFELPTYERENSVYAYYFYRLIQRAQNICLLYNTETGDSGEGEMSRYLYQLKYDFNFKINEYILAHKVESLKYIDIVVEKDLKVQNILSKYCVTEDNVNKRLTPSAINTFLDCSLKFYFRYVAGLYEPDVVQEEVDPMVMGNILHHTMQSLYNELIIKKQNAQLIMEEDFGILEDRLDHWIEESFKKHYGMKGKKFHFHGHNIIMKNIILIYTNAILKIDKKYCPFEIISMEERNKNYDLDFEITIDGQLKKVGLTGIIDRIDKKDNIIRVIDYKTGKDEKKFESIESLFDREDGSRNKAALQTLFYGMLFRESSSGQQNIIIPGVFSVKEMFSDQFDYRLFKKSGRQEAEYVDNIDYYLDAFKSNLKNTLEELFDKAHSFIQTEDDKKCNYCPYSMICHRDMNSN